MKKFLSIILAILMVVTMLPMAVLPASAATATGGCDGSHSGYTAISGKKTITTAGNYYLTSNVSVSGASYPLTIHCSGTVTLCLNGYDIYQAGTSSVVVDIKATGGDLTVNLCDCKGTGEIYRNSRSYVGISLKGDSSNGYYATLNMYGGTIRDCLSGVSEYPNTRFNMYGGTIKNCLNYGVIQDSSAGKVNIYGGTITGNPEGIRVCSADGVILTGSPSIYGNTNGDIYYRKSYPITVKDLSVSQKMTLGFYDATDFTVAIVDTADALHYFECVRSGQNLSYSDGKILLHTGTATYTVNAEDSTKHDVTFSCCGTTVTEGHTGGEATCKEQAKCEHCGASYGELDADNHTGGTATCTEQAKCEHCGASYGDIDATAHSWANLDGVCANGCGEVCPHESYTDGFCTVCGATCTHTGGTATCTEQAKCEHCGASYGELDPDNHDFGSGNTCICGAEIAFTGIVVDDENSDEYRYDETSKTYTIIIPADEVGGTGYLSYDIIGTNLTLIEDTNTLLKVQHENEDGLTSAPDDLLVDVLQVNGYFGWSVLGYGDGEWEKLLYSNDGGMTWTTYTFEVKQAYSITVNASQNGTVTANEYAIEGDNIALNVSPAEGYMLDTLSVTDASGNSVDVENNAFTMPASAVTVTATFAVCDHKDGRHETATDNGDGTHDATYSCCGAIVAEVPHTLDITTGKCSACGADMTAIATVTDSTNTYYAADAATLNQAVTAILETGSRTFTVELPADTEAEMITAIRRAICDTEGVADGSINLTLGGVTSIPGTTNWDGVAFGPRNAQWDENNVEIVSHEEVTQLASVNLPDATEIGAQAFYFCENLVSVSAPKAQTIGAQAFGYTALTSVEFPELTTIPTDMFSGTWTLSSAKFPKVTTIEQGGLLIGAKFNPENNPTPFPLELTAEGDITFNGSYHFNIASRNYSGKVDLVLNIDKKDQVTFNDDGTATWQVRDDLSYTFKSITFTCTDGTTNHSYTYTDNGDGTHDKVCDICRYVEVDNEAHTIENHVCTACGAMEIVVSFDAGDYEWKTGDTLYFCRVSGDNEWEEYAFTATVAGDGTVTWTPDKTLYWDGTGEHKLVVVYPGDTPWAWDRFYVGDDQTTTEKLHEFDLMNAMWSGNPTTDPITLNLKHRLAKVTVNYEIAEGVTVSKAEVYTLTQYLLFDIHTLERKNIAWEEGHDLWINSYLNDGQFTAFVSPDAYAADGNFIKITLSNGTVYEVKMNKAVTFAEGAEYSYKVIITADGAYLTCADECSFEYIANEDGLTHSKVCTECGYVAASENHTLTYSVDGNTITAYCSANCGYSGTATIGAEGKTYDGNAVEVVVSKTGSLENTIIPVTLTKDGEAFTGAPVNAGTYTASIGMGENENAVVASVEFIIEKANPVIAAAPTPNTLTYIGEAQYLISAGEAVGRTMVYSLTENGEYTTSIPQGTNAGDYTVWYYVQGDANHNDSAKATVDVTIEKAPLTVTASDATITYGEAPTNNGVTYSGFVNGENEGVFGGELAYTYTYTQNGNVGDYSITPEGLTADNYEITFVDGTLTVEQIDINDIIDEMKINLEQYSYVYDGTEKKPKVTSITVDGVTLTEGTDYTVRYEDNVYVGNYATAVIVFEGNYDGAFRKWFTITKAYYDLTAPTPNTLTYNGEEQDLVSAGTVEGADFEYSLDGVSWSTSIPQAKDEGNYTVYYRVLADENHYDVEGTVDVTINKCAHEWNDGVLTRPERITTTEWDDGYYTYTCTVCGEEKTETAKRADYTAFEAVMTDYIDIVNNKSVLDSVKNELSSIYQQNRDVTGGNRIETEQAEVDTVVKLLSDKIDEIKAEIEDGTAVKADYTEIDEAIKAVDEALENATISEEMADNLSDIKSQLEALKVNENTSMADAAELLERVKAVAETMADCANGIHSFTKYEVTEEAECGKAGKEVATCDNGCGATDEKEIPALTHKDDDGDYLCDHGCGHEFEKPAEPDTPDTPDEPTDDTCDHLCHKDGILGFLWKIISFFYRLFNIQQYCDCGVIHYDAPVFG